MLDPGSWRAVRLFAEVLLGLLAAFFGSAIVFGELGDLWPGGTLDRLTRFCLFLMLVTAYTAAAVGIMRRGAARDFAALRGVTDAGPDVWEGWERRFRDRRAGLAAAACGLVVGIAIERLGSSADPIHDAESWLGLRVWALLLNGLLFANLGMLARWSVLEIRALRAIGRRVRVSLLDREGLAPFVRTGLRSALLWLTGSSLAVTLLLDVNAPWLVLAVLTVTTGLAFAALLLPSRGLHERLRAAREAELRFVRGEIASVRDALGAGARPDANERIAQLPALLAWEARVERMSVWPFDAPSLFRFALLLLVPLGSWLGGALVERAVDAWIDR
ncbi:MAG: hypothetical protein MUF70_04905 [Myxococcota bacterium]|jgi:hypothetical protein|nr:hypothetical protein [Myxococcota bacterium]